MKISSSLFSIAGLGLLAFSLNLRADDAYRILDTTQLMGTGGIDYVYADNDARRIYVPRGGNTYVFGLDDHKYIDCITNVGGHGIAVDTASHHGIASGSPISVFDTATLQKTGTIEPKARPDGILFEPFTGKVAVLSHEDPSVTLVDAKAGTITGTIDVGGAMEGAASDGAGKLYIDVEDQKKIAVVDLKTMKLVTKYDLGSTAGEPAGLGFDAKNQILFAMCAKPDVCVVVSAKDGKVLATLPIGSGTDAGGFNPATMEAFSSQRDGTLTIIKEKSPTEFEVEQNLNTKQGAKTCTLDTKNNHIVLITVERSHQAEASTASTNQPAGGQRPKRFSGPGMLDVLFVGK